MKKIGLFISLVLFATLSAQAENYVIKIRGTILSANGRIRVTETDLVRTNGNILVYNIDTASKTFNIFESDTTGVPSFGEQVHSDDAVVTPNGRGIVTDLHQSDGFAGNVSGVPAFSGRLIGGGRIVLKQGVPSSFRMSVAGIWNSADNSVFRGVITGKRLP